MKTDSVKREILNNGTSSLEESPRHFWDAGYHSDGQKQVVFPWQLGSCPVGALASLLMSFHMLPVSLSLHPTDTTISHWKKLNIYYICYTYHSIESQN